LFADGISRKVFPPANDFPDFIGKLFRAMVDAQVFEIGPHHGALEIGERSTKNKARRTPLGLDPEVREGHSAARDRESQQKIGRWGERQKMRCCRRIPLIVLVIAGCSRSDQEGLARVGRKLADRANIWMGELRDQLDLGGNVLQTRVAERLRWDKKLVDLPIHINARGGEVELTGVVPDSSLKQRAVELAEATAGVESVLDHIQVVDLNPTPVPAPKTGN
jgi:hypothetical protein